MSQHRHILTLLPYTTLFRSQHQNARRFPHALGGDAERKLAVVATESQVIGGVERKLRAAERLSVRPDDPAAHRDELGRLGGVRDRKSTRLNSSHGYISYAVF